MGTTGRALVTMNFVLEKNVAGISRQTNSSLSFINSRVVQHRDKDGVAGVGGWGGYRKAKLTSFLLASESFVVKGSSSVRSNTVPVRQEPDDSQTDHCVISSISVSQWNSFVVMYIISFTLTSFSVMVGGTLSRGVRGDLYSPFQVSYVQLDTVSKEISWFGSDISKQLVAHLWKKKNLMKRYI